MIKYTRDLFLPPINSRIVEDNEQLGIIVLVTESGCRRWYRYGLSHRDGGPAMEFTDGSKIWHCDDKLHNLNGPAIQRANRNRFDADEWWIYGKKIRCHSQEEFVKYLKFRCME